MTACDTCNKTFDRLIMYARGGLWYCSSCNKKVDDIMKCGGCGQIISGKWTKPPGATVKWHQTCWDQQKGGPVSQSAIPELPDNKGEGVRPVKVTAFERLQKGIGEAPSSSTTTDDDSDSYSTPAPATQYSTSAPAKPATWFCSVCGGTRTAAQKFCSDCGST